MSRNFPDWLSAYVKYASVTEAPKRMHFWSGVCTIAGALRRKVWIDMKRFRWHCNFYVVFVAKPGIVSKSTTADIAMDLLKQVPGIKFGPDIVTWPALTKAFAESSEFFDYQGEFHPMSAMTLVASEFGNLVNMADKDMINLYINLWDGRKSLDKRTKGNGNDLVEAPWINMLGCTTPNWIADNVQHSAVGGGFTSRCVFIYASEKERYIPFVDEVVEGDDDDLRIKLIQDLEDMSINLAGPFIITPEARAWERQRYENFWKLVASRVDSSAAEGYAARKQTHLFKTAMILSVSRGESLQISQEDLELANRMLDDLEPDLNKVFAQIGRSEDSIQAETFVEYVKKKGPVSYEEAYRAVHIHFPDHKAFEGIVAGSLRSGLLRMEQRVDGLWLSAGN